MLSIGIHASVEMIGNLVWGKAMFNLQFLFVFAGLGLLRGSSVHRGCFGGLLALGVVGAALYLVLAGATKVFSSDQVEWLDLGIAAFVFLSLTYCFVVLWDARNDEWFAEKLSGKAPPYIIPVTVVLTLLYAISGELNTYRRDRLMDEIFHYDVEIVARDAATNEVLKYLGVRHPDHNLSDADVPNWMRASRSSSRQNGALVIEGYAHGVTQVGVLCDGYETVWVDLNRETGSEVEVLMKRVEE